MNDEILNSLEDIIAENSNSPDKLSRELEGLLTVYSRDHIIETLKYGEVFGDPKLSGILMDFFSGSTKPLDSAYIKSLDFCEGKVCELVKDVEKLSFAEDIFRTTLVEPMFLTDSGTYKHELIDNFKSFKILLTGDEITGSLKLDEICSPTVVSFINNLEGKTYNDSETTKELIEQTNRVFNFCESKLAKVLYSKKDFSLAQKIKTSKGASYLSRLLTDKALKESIKNSRFQKPRNMSCEDKEKERNLKYQKGDFETSMSKDDAIARNLQEKSRSYSLKLGMTKESRGSGKYIPTKPSADDRGANGIPIKDNAQKRPDQNGRSDPGGLYR